ncbi:MAG: bifunctional enoyl-CoA hydratase/phosphate acetyltransferase [Bacillota bacterium]|nr:bifunctional enoyl-CoA hydratase/phosphate acetyltransferase [Bacillota bacterium]
MVKNFKELFTKAENQKRMVLAVAAANDENVLKAVCSASERGLITPILIGDEEKIKDVAKSVDVNIDSYEIINKLVLEDIAETTVKLVNEGKADFLMKGLIDTAVLLRAVLNKEYGLRTDSQLSHVMVYDVKNYHKLLYLTDGGMNITPTFEEKVKITKNAIDVVKAMGNEIVKIAGIAAKEKVNEKMIATVEARKLQQMSKNGDFGENVIFEGPLALDLAVSLEAAEVKGFKSDIAGDTDVLLVPTIEVGNGIGKTLTYLANASSAGIIMGAKVPVVLVSRADSFDAKLNSIALGSVIAANN